MFLTHAYIQKHMHIPRSPSQAAAIFCFQQLLVTYHLCTGRLVLCKSDFSPDAAKKLWPYMYTCHCLHCAVCGSPGKCRQLHALFFHMTCCVPWHRSCWQCEIKSNSWWLVLHKDKMWSWISIFHQFWSANPTDIYGHLVLPAENVRNSSRHGEWQTKQKGYLSKGFPWPQNCVFWTQIFHFTSNIY